MRSGIVRCRREGGSRWRGSIEFAKVWGQGGAFLWFSAVTIKVHFISGTLRPAGLQSITDGCVKLLYDARYVVRSKRSVKPRIAPEGSNEFCST